MKLHNTLVILFCTIQAREKSFQPILRKMMNESFNFYMRGNVDITFCMVIITFSP